MAETNHIRHIKLVTGDEILAEVVGEDTYELLIVNPFKILKERMIIRGQPREVNFFTRWMGFSESQEFFIQKQHILVEAPVDQDVVRHYDKLIINSTEADSADDNKFVNSMDQDNHPSDEEQDALSKLLELVNVDPDKKTYH